MKKMLIVGPNSYIAKTFMSQLAPESFITISVRDESWQDLEFSNIGSVIYFAAIVHHPEIEDATLYEKVNALTPYAMAQKAAAQGVENFIYISTLAVYGTGPKLGHENRIGLNTPILPCSLYGKSKKQGEDLLLSVNNLNVQIVRLPNVYGKCCPGTFYHRIEWLAKLPLLPILSKKYKFSLISVENVAKALVKILQIKESGIFIPQDIPVLSIVDRIRNMAAQNGVNQIQSYIFMPLIWLANKILPKKYTDNLYGGLYVDISDFPPLID